jgi:YbbR domain-containing protein
MALKNTLLENLRVKLVVGALAVLFWFAVVTENIYEYDIDVPIVAVNVPEGKILAKTLTKMARVRFEGRGRALLRLLFSREARVILDLSNVRRRYAFALQRQMVHAPRGGAELAALQILYPDTVQVLLTNLLQKPVRLSADVKINTIPGYTVIPPFRFDPDSIIIAGPEEIVRHIDSVMTEHKEFANVQQNIAERLRLRPFPESQHIKLSSHIAQFYADVEKLIEVTLQEIPVQVYNVPKHLKITPVPSTLSLTVEGGEKLLLHLKKENIVAYIDYTRIRDSATAGHPAYIQTPEGVRYRDVKPALFKLIIETSNHAAARH